MILRRLLLGAALFTGAAFSFAQTPNPASGVYLASEFSGWVIPGQSAQGAGSFTWPTATICTVTSGGYTFKAFAVGRPVTIVDNNPAHTETVTPTGAIYGPVSCGFTATTQYTHYSYYVKSGTAGLQEAIDYANGQNMAGITPGGVVTLTPGWTVAGGANGTISAAYGSSAVSILDERVALLCAYAWNGSNYVPSGCGAGGLSGGGTVAHLSQWSGSATIGDSTITYSSGNGYTVPADMGMTPASPSLCVLTNGLPSANCGLWNYTPMLPYGGAAGNYFDALVLTKQETTPASASVYNGFLGMQVYHKATSGGVNNFNGTTGTKTDYIPFQVSAEQRTVGQKWGVQAQQWSMSAGDTIPILAEVNQFGGYGTTGDEGTIGFYDLLQQGSAQTTGTGGVAEGTITAINSGTGVVSFTALHDINTMGEQRFIRDLGSAYSTGTYSAVSCTGSPNTCTITGSGTSWTSISGFVGTHTTWNSLATGGNITSTNLVFCAAPAANDGYDFCVPVTTGVSDTSLTVNLYGVGAQQNTGWPTAASGSYAIYRAAWPTSVNVISNTFTAPDVSGLTIGHNFDQVLAYNTQITGTRILISRHIGLPNTGGGIDISNVSDADAPPLDYGLEVDGPMFSMLTMGLDGDAAKPGHFLYTFSDFGGALFLMESGATSSLIPFQYMDSGGSQQVPLTISRNVASSPGLCIYNAFCFNTSSYITTVLNTFSDIDLQSLNTATSGANYSSQQVNLNGSYWTGSAAATDSWQLYTSLGTGANPSSEMVIGHTGSSGFANVSIPYYTSFAGGALIDAAGTGHFNNLLSSALSGAVGNCVTIGSSGLLGSAGVPCSAPGVASINAVAGAFTFSFSAGAGSCSGTTCTFTGSGSGGGSVTNFIAGTWPSWLTPSVATSTTTPTLSVTAFAIPNASLATQTANTLLGALTATTPSGIAVPSCDGASNALTWTSGTGFGCNTITGGGGGGSVTSVGLTVPAWLTVTGSPITTSGTLAITGTSETANFFLAAPNGSAGAMTPRAIVAADIPTLNQNTTGQANHVANALTINNSGAGAGSGATFDGSGAVTISCNTVGASCKIASGTVSLPTTSVAANSCDASPTTASATGVATTDVIGAGFNSDPTAITGYNSGVFVMNYPTANTVNFKRCNSTASPITPSAATLNWQVVR